MRAPVTPADFRTEALIAELERRKEKGEAVPELQEREAPFISAKADRLYLPLNDDSMDIQLIIRDSGCPKLAFTLHNKPSPRAAEAAWELNRLFESDWQEKRAIINFCRVNWAAYGDEAKLKKWLDEEEGE